MIKNQVRSSAGGRVYVGETKIQVGSDKFKRYNSDSISWEREEF